MYNVEIVRNVHTSFYPICISCVCSLYSASYITNNKSVHCEQISISKKQRDEWNSCFIILSCAISFVPNVRLRHELYYSIPQSNSSLPICRGPTYVHQRYKTHFWKVAPKGDLWQGTGDLSGAIAHKKKKKNWLELFSRYKSYVLPTRKFRDIPNYLGTLFYIRILKK